jgi:DNA-binding NarL/FixJ family response regulator
MATGDRPPLRVVIAEDELLLRQGIVAVLNACDFDVVAAVGDAGALVDSVEHHAPDVVITDIRMPPTHTTEGLDAALQLRRSHPDLGVLLVSQHVVSRHATELLGARGGGCGYLLKDRITRPDDLADAVTRIAAGDVVVDPDLVERLIARREQDRRVAQLTAREREILAAMAEGHSNAAICERLFISAKTLENHVSRIFTKLDLPPCSDQHRRVTAVLVHLRS